ncbi:MAG: hypothetical protein KBB21_37180 [Nannocystaceae bacterium]|nr:hypothetical protein [Nannocystaceae bacterium]
MGVRGASMVVAIACACTRPNPLFGDRESATGDGTTTSQGSGSATASEASTTPVTSADASSGTTGVSSSTTQSEDGSSGHAADMGPACTLPEPLELGIAVAQDGVDFNESCDVLELYGPLERVGGSLSLVDCGGCDLCVGSPFSITVTGVALPVLPSCASIVLWGTSVDSVCVWEGLAVFDDGALAPHYVLSLTQSPSPMAFPGFAVMSEAIDDCPTPNCPEAALLRLDFPGSGDTTIAPDDAPKPMELAFPSAPAAAKWIVDDLQSMLAPDCKRHVAWTATRP